MKSEVTKNLDNKSISIIFDLDKTLVKEPLEPKKVAFQLVKSEYEKRNKNLEEVVEKKLFYLEYPKTTLNNYLQDLATRDKGISFTVDEREKMCKDADRRVADVFIFTENIITEIEIK